MMPYGNQTLELIQRAFLLSQVVIVIMMVVSAVLEAMLSSGVRPRATITSSGPASCTPPVAMCSGTATTSLLELPSVASGIEFKEIDKSAQGTW